MKKIYYIITMLFLLNFKSMAQNIGSHQSQLPPLNPGNTFTRGMYVDCASDIVDDMVNGNNLGLKQELFNYIRNNGMSYIILCGLEQSGIFGNAFKEAALKHLLFDTKNTFPFIRIAASGNEANIISQTPSITFSPFTSGFCFPSGTLNSINALNDALNNSGLNSVNLKRTELCKFFLRAAMIGMDSGLIKSNYRCKGAFDALYLEYRYWNHTSSLADMQNEFNNYKTLLSVMQTIKCKYNCIRKVDAEFFPTDIFKLQAWTAIDQITEADPLADRLIIPSLTNNATGVFDNICKTMHYLSDRFSKPHSDLLIEVSAESPNFTFCNSTLTPHNYLGDYLNGSVTPSGNMYTVEKAFLDKFNNSNYFCSLCSCYPFNDNHYSITNTSGNVLSGMLWTPYSILKPHNLFKSPDLSEVNTLFATPILNQLIDLNGRIIKNYKLENDVEELNESVLDGMYFHRITYSDGRQEIKKVFIHR